MSTATTSTPSAAEEPDVKSTGRGRGSVRGGARPLRALLPVSAALVLLALWELGGRVFSVPQYVLPMPSDIWRSLNDDSALLMDNAWPTIIESALGFAVGNAVAVLLAIVFVHYRPVERALMPVALFIRTIPIVAIAPVLVIMMGNGYAPKVAIGALISFFPTLVNMVRGLQAVDQQSLELLRVLSASPWEILFKVRMYASLPYLFSSLKIATGNCVIGAIVAEWIGSQQGLGYLIIQTTYNFNTPQLYAVMVIASAIAIVFYALVGTAERLTVRWEAKAP
ncbi:MULTISPECIES: ABC transporter permease [Streptomyces violaceusniger group]|uniref:ABC transporter permease n=2 Tax=Streptomyces javensis TaxID=114698 RepID=A0ABS0R4C3_9ACTN|nr:ABC transporter permease [Streptomyces javensis]MBI0312222.1 ABC transporter permease [Streptomyces javensis]